MRIVHFLAVTAAALATAALAQTTASDDPSHHPAAVAAVNAAPMSTEGEVRKIDREQGKVTLKHGPIEHLDMPGMTMVFSAADSLP